MSFTKLISSIRFPRGPKSQNFWWRTYSSGQDAPKEGEKKPTVENKVVKRTYSTAQDAGTVLAGGASCGQGNKLNKVNILSFSSPQNAPCGGGAIGGGGAKSGPGAICGGGAISGAGGAVSGGGVISGEVAVSQGIAISGGVTVSGGGAVSGGKGGVVIGVYEDCKTFELTPAAEELNQKCGGKIMQRLNELSCQMKLGKAFVITEVDEYSAVALACLGPREPGYDALEALDVTQENVRWAIGAGVRALQERCVGRISIDTAGQDAAAAEAANLAAWIYQEFRTTEIMQSVTLSPLGAVSSAWLAGSIRGVAQNWARELTDTPANVMTPVDLAQAAIDILCPLGITVEAHGREWIEARNMQAFLAVARGSCSEPMFIECVYRGAGGDQPPVLLAAKGVTFDSGGLCLKSCASMTENRGSMAGAAVVLATLKACAELKVPLNISAVIPCCENMISGQCMKVGDVVKALNGMSILVEDTDLEGRLMLADALVYGQTTYKPELVIDVATLTQGVALATGGGAFGCFTSCAGGWAALQAAGAAAGDRPWRLPLWDYYTKQVTNDVSVDLRNKGSGSGSPCLGAAFLKHFVCCSWMHLDITGVGKLAHGAPPYLAARRMTGRPARTLTVLLENIARDCGKQPETTVHL